MVCFSPSPDYDVKLNRNNLHGFKYKLTGTDLRVLSQVEAKLEESDVDFSLPTVFIAECVLVYMCTSKSSQLLNWIAKKFKSSLFINYEMVISIQKLKYLINRSMNI